MPKNFIEIVDHDLRQHHRLARIDDISHGRFFRTHEGRTEANGQVVDTHLGRGLEWGHVFFEELDDEHEGDEI